MIIQERFPGDDHRQIYWAWREYPRAMRITLCLGFMCGLLLATVVMLVMRVAQ